MLGLYTQGLLNSVMLLTESQGVNLVKQGSIVGPISNFLGSICDYIYNFVCNITSVAPLGITIIIFTIVIRIIILPLSAYSAKSMSKMKIIQPEMKKLQEKYKGKTDIESKKRLNAEMSELQRKHGANPLNGCLPLLIQMPIFFALFFILQRTYLYISAIGELYTKMGDLILGVPKIGTIMKPIVESIPTLKTYVQGVHMEGFLWWKKEAPASYFDLAAYDNCREVISKMSDSNWAALLSQVPADVSSQLVPLLEQKASIEYFLGINLVERPTLLAISIIIPILSGVTTFLSTWLMNKAQGPAVDDQVRMQQKMMLIMLPVMMGVMTFTFPAGLGLYWTVGNIFQMGQQYVFNKIFDPTKSKRGAEEVK